MQTLRIQPVRNQVLGWLYESRRSSILEEFLRKGAHVYVLGGAVRDLIAPHVSDEENRIPRDFDIGVAGVSVQAFDDALSSLGARNRHGGFLLNEFGKPNWDVWRLERSIGLRKTSTDYSIENVLRSFNLDCNAIALDLRTGWLIDGGAIGAIRRKQVGFVPSAIKHSADTFAAKSLLMQLRFQYSVSSEMHQSIRRHLSLKTLEHESRKVFPGIAMLNLAGQA